EDGKTRSVELPLTGAGWQIGVGAGEPTGLQTFVSVAIERHRLPFAVQNGPERDVIGDLAGIAEHRFADVVGRVSVIVGAQVFRMAEIDADIFAAQLETGVGHAVAEFGIEYSDAVAP